MKVFAVFIWGFMYRSGQNVVFYRRLTPLLFFASTFSGLCLWIDFTGFKDAYASEGISGFGVVEEITSITQSLRVFSNESEVR